MIYFKLLFIFLLKDIIDLSGFINHIKYSYNLKKSIHCHNEIIITHKSFNGNYSGYDLTNSTYDNTTIENIRELYYKKNILDKLIDNNIGINDKLKFIEYYDLFPKRYNIDITEGGLFSDWNYTIPDEIL